LLLESQIVAAFHRVHKPGPSRIGPKSSIQPLLN
jgi:hypothetical protein